VETVQPSLPGASNAGFDGLLPMLAASEEE
jgi:hypothetical protein